MQTPRTDESPFRVDLHAHTTASDGALTPAELVARAAGSGVTHLAVTDHDTTAGIVEAVATGRAHGVNVLAGVELSTLWQGREIHVVGLGLGAHPVLDQGLAYQQDQRLRRAERIADKLSQRGLADAGSVIGVQGRRSPGRSHFADWLVSQGVVRDRQQAFKRYLGRQGRAWVRPEWVSLETAVRWIRLAGGCSVLAHPHAYRMTGAWLRRLCEAFAGAGGDAIEVVTGRSTVTQVRDALGLSLRHGLAASCGSDFHAPGAGLEPGQLAPLPGAAEPIWQRVPGLLERAPHDPGSTTSASVPARGQGGSSR